MLSLLQRYLAAHFVPPFVMSTIFFISFLLTFQLFRVVRLMAKRDLDYDVILSLVGHLGMSFLPMAVPLSTLFAAMYTTNKLSEDSEIVAMRSFGLKKGQLIAPLAIIGCLIGFAIFGLNRNIIPFSKSSFRNTIIGLSATGAITDIKGGDFFTKISNVVLFPQSLDEKTDKMENLFIVIEKDNQEQIIMAKKGNLVKQKTGKYSTPAMRLHLNDGNIIKTFGTSQKVEKILFGTYDFPILAGGHVPGFVTKDSMRSNNELLRVINYRTKKIGDMEKLSRLDTIQKIKLNDLKKRLPKTKLEYWTRWNTPFQCLVFVLLGFVLGIKKGRGRSQNAGVIALVILIAYYALFFGFVGLSRKGLFPAGLAVFTPTILAFIVGSVFYKKIDWYS